jgi:hypothetical protein
VAVVSSGVSISNGEGAVGPQADRIVLNSMVEIIHLIAFLLSRNIMNLL